MDLQERVQFAILTKYYGNLLTAKQKTIISMYVDNNLSLSEVSDEIGITRQAVKDALDSALEALKMYEKQLGFIARDEKIKELMDKKSLGEIDMATRLQISSILEDN